MIKIWMFLWIILLAHLSLSASMKCLAEEGLDATAETKPTKELALSVNEPIYFVAGVGLDGVGDIKSRFQFSFKYRLFDDDSVVTQKVNWLENLHFAYTQTSLWNLSADSEPFEDSSYRPSFFVDLYNKDDDWMPAFVRTGYEHESNGQANLQSRSIDTFYFWPFWGGKFQGRDWFIGPKFWAYLSKDETNKDIAEFRGNSEIWFQYGNEDSWLIAAKIRPGRFNHAAYQLEYSYPLRDKIFSRTGGYFFIQVFDGYGESLLNYNQRTETQIRIGFAIVR